MGALLGSQPPGHSLLEAASLEEMDKRGEEGASEMRDYEMKCCKFLLSKVDKYGAKRLEDECIQSLKARALVLVDGYPLQTLAFSAASAAVGTFTAAVFVDSMLNLSRPAEGAAMKAGMSASLLRHDRQQFAGRAAAAWGRLYELVPEITDTSRKVSTIWEVHRDMDVLINEVAHMLGSRSRWCQDEVLLFYTWRHAICTYLVATSYLIELGEVTPKVWDSAQAKLREELRSNMPKLLAFRRSMVQQLDGERDLEVDMGESCLGFVASFQLYDEFTQKVSPTFKRDPDKGLSQEVAAKMAEYLDIIERNASCLEACLPPS